MSWKGSYSTKLAIGEVETMPLTRPIVCPRYTDNFTDGNNDCISFASMITSTICIYLTRFSQPFVCAGQLYCALRLWHFSNELNTFLMQTSQNNNSTATKCCDHRRSAKQIIKRIWCFNENKKQKPTAWHTIHTLSLTVLRKWAGVRKSYVWAVIGGGLERSPPIN